MPPIDPADFGKWTIGFVVFCGAMVGIWKLFSLIRGVGRMEFDSLEKRVTHIEDNQEKNQRAALAAAEARAEKLADKLLHLEATFTERGKR